MKTVVEILINAWRNKHTSSSAIVLFVATTVGIIWPKIKPQADEIARAAIIYGLITAGDAKSSVQLPPKS